MISSSDHTTWSEKAGVLAGGKRKRAILELIQGRDSAAKLQRLLRQPLQDSVDDQLIHTILKSFTNTLSVLTSGGDLEEAYAPPDLSPVGSACSDDRRSVDSGDLPVKRHDKRGCYKRRKNVETWTTVTPTVEDGQAWRKYGQKDILNSKHPRAYFRCTRKFDQGCRATKQVQLMEDDSQLYKSTYIGVHTCNRDMVKPPQVVADSDPNWGSYHKTSDDQWNIQSAIDHQQHGRCLFGLSSSGHVCGLKEEDKERDNINIPTIESISWPDVLSFDSSEDVSMVYSCTDTSSHNLDMGFVVNSVHFDNLDENEFL